MKRYAEIDFTEQQESTEDDWSASTRRTRIGNNKAHRSKATRTQQRKAARASKKRNR